MKLFIFSQMKFENISEFSLITLVSTLESRIIGGVGVIGGLYIVIIINDRGVGRGYKNSVGGFLVLIHNTFFFPKNGHIFPIQFNIKKLRNNGI